MIRAQPTTYLCQEMKQLVSFLLLSGLLMQVFSKQLALMEYDFNKKFISKELCVKKEIPGNTCAGQCHLKKELSKDENSPSGQQSKIKSGAETLWINGSVLLITFLSNNLESNHYEIHSGSPQEWSADIFQPPGLIVSVPCC
jgi:hypothetical protein